jgi:hypothetical protein
MAPKKATVKRFVNYATTRLQAERDQESERERIYQAHQDEQLSRVREMALDLLPAEVREYTAVQWKDDYTLSVMIELPECSPLSIVLGTEREIDGKIFNSDPNLYSFYTYKRVYFRDGREWGWRVQKWVPYLDEDNRGAVGLERVAENIPAEEIWRAIGLAAELGPTLEAAEDQAALMEKKEREAPRPAEPTRLICPVLCLDPDAETAWCLKERCGWYTGRKCAILNIGWSSAE